MATWEQLEKYCLNCHRCKLYSGRTNVVIGDGNKNADIMFIGEGPGQQEDLQGLPFVGPAGQLFNKMLNSIGLDRKKVYICNVVKCRPPYNRDPEDDEKQACLPLLRAQVSLVKPKIIVCLGRIAGNVVMHPNFRITKEHGVWEERKGYWLSATYHPSALLRDPLKKREAWEDLKKLRAKIEELQIFANEPQAAANQANPNDTKANENPNSAPLSSVSITENNISEPPVTAVSSEELPWEAEENDQKENISEEKNQEEKNLEETGYAETEEITEIDETENFAVQNDTAEPNPFDDIDFSPNIGLPNNGWAGNRSNNISDDDLDLLVF